jgi:hypothetical protein
MVAAQRATDLEIQRPVPAAAGAVYGREQVKTIKVDCLGESSDQHAPLANNSPGFGPIQPWRLHQSHSSAICCLGNDADKGGKSRHDSW